MNVMMLAKVVLHILQQGPEEGTLNFKTSDQAIRNISKVIDVTINKAETQKLKELKAQNKKWKSVLKLQRKNLWKKGIQL